MRWQPVLSAVLVLLLGTHGIVSTAYVGQSVAQPLTQNTNTTEGCDNHSASIEGVISSGGAELYGPGYVENVRYSSGPVMTGSTGIVVISASCPERISESDIVFNNTTDSAGFRVRNLSTRGDDVVLGSDNVVLARFDVSADTQPITYSVTLQSNNTTDVAQFDVIDPTTARLGTARAQDYGTILVDAGVPFVTSVVLPEGGYLVVRDPDTPSESLARSRYLPPGSYPVVTFPDVPLKTGLEIVAVRGTSNSTIGPYEDGGQPVTTTLSVGRTVTGPESTRSTGPGFTPLTTVIAVILILWGLAYIK